MVGARLLAGPWHSHKVSMIIDIGNDFPRAIREEIDGWNTGTLWRETPERKTTR